MPAEKSVSAVRRIPWAWIGVAALLVVLILAGRLLPFDQWLKQFREWVTGIGPWAVPIYALVYAAAAVLFVPGSVLTIGAGFAFGLLWGTVAVSTGSTLAAALAFLIARHLARERVLALAKRNEKFSAIDKAIGREGWKIVLLLRLSDE